jgi:iron-sulfur cluster repair protein YtfE (RIC family)
MQDHTQFRAIHLIAEHHRIHRMLRLAQDAVWRSGGPNRESPPIDVIQVLRQVRNELARHFMEEESGDYLHDAVARWPSLLADVRQIEAEHPQLLAGVDRLIALAKDCDQSVQERVALAREFDELCRHLGAHEAAENAVLRKEVGTACGTAGSHSS